MDRLPDPLDRPADTVTLTDIYDHKISRTPDGNPTSPEVTMETLGIDPEQYTVEMSFLLASILGRPPRSDDEVDIATICFILGYYVAHHRAWP